MSAPVFQRPNYSDLYGSTMLPALETLFRSEFAQHPSKREMLFKEKMVSNGIYQYSEIHDMPLPAVVDEGEDYSFSRPRPGASKTLIPVKWGIGASISLESIRDAKFDVVADIIRKMAKSCSEGQEIDAMNIFNLGFSTVTTADGLSLFNSGHTLPSGTTWSNVLDTPSDLSYSSLDTMLTNFATRQVGDSGIINNIRATKLLVPEGLRRYASEILGSDKKVDVQYNNINSFKGEGIELASSPHLTDPDAWYVLADKADTGLVIVKSNGVETKSWEKPENDSFLYKAQYREKIGAENAYGAFGTAGA